MKESYTKTINREAATKATQRIDKLLSFILSECPKDETWKEISWADNGEYWVSDKGRILSFYNSSPIIMEPFACGGGYYYITIYGHDRRIHRLVAQAFLPNPEAKPIVHHKDGNKQNNTLENLAWATHAENTQAYFDSKKKPNE